MLWCVAGGAPDYLSPEHIFCTGVDHGVDLWAMGVLVFEMCLKRTPFNPDGDAHVQDIFKAIAQTKVSHEQSHEQWNRFEIFTSVSLSISTRCTPISCGVGYPSY
mgnify:CR=1 FL=1